MIKHVCMWNVQTFLISLHELSKVYVNADEIRSFRSANVGSNKREISVRESNVRPGI